MSLPNLDVLFQPLQLKSLALKNRVVMAPMTRSFSPGGVPSADMAAYYRRRAENGVGLILSEGTVVDRPASRNEPGIPFFHGEQALAGWQNVLAGVHAAGGKMGPQLWHVGAVKDMYSEWVPDAPVESPSGLAAPGAPRGEAMSDEAIADAIASFARAAADAVRLGFDTLEIHGAHGYLIDQFFWQETNLRKDKFGGATLKERSRFAAEVIKAARAAVGPSFPIILRVSQWKMQNFSGRLATSPAEMSDWLTPLVEAGADVLHCSQRRFWQPEFPEVDGEEGLNLAGWAKKVTGATTISVGSVGLAGDSGDTFNGEQANVARIGDLVRRMEGGEFDLIAIGRALLTDPAWLTKLRANEVSELRGFDPSALQTLY